MIDRTRKLWDTQHRLVGDRRGLFEAVAALRPIDAVLYPGSYVDLTPSFVWPSVTYVDVDQRAKRFFSDADGVDELLDTYDVDPDRRLVRFLHADFTDPLDLGEESADLLVSLYAGFVSEHCTRYLRRGGLLMVNSSHGDAAMASIDPRYQLHAVIEHRSGTYRTRTDGLDDYLVPRRDVEITPAGLHERGRGIAYTKSPYAYLFERVS